MLAATIVASLVALWSAWSGVRQFRAAMVYREAVDEHALVGGEETLPAMERSIELYGEAARIQPTLLSATYRLASLRASMSHYVEPAAAWKLLDEARADFERVESLWPNYAEAPLNRSILEGAAAARLVALHAAKARGGEPSADAKELSAALERLDEAVAQARRFQSWSDRYTAWRQLGDAHARKARFLDEFGAAAGAKETSSTAWLQACVAHDGALRAARRAESIPNGSPPNADDVELIRYNLLDALKALAEAPDLAALDLSGFAAGQANAPAEASADEAVVGFDLAGAMELLREVERGASDAADARRLVFLHQAASVAGELRREHPDRDDLAAEEIELWLRMGDVERAALAAWSQVRDQPLSAARWGDFALAAELAGRPDIAEKAKRMLARLADFLGGKTQPRSAPEAAITGGE